MKILIIGPSWVGDMMISQSLYRTLKQIQPSSIIDIMAPEWALPLVHRMPEINHAIVMPIGHNSLALRERYQLGKQLQKQYYQQAYILPNSFKSALIPFFARIPQRIGWKGEQRYILLTDMRKLDPIALPLMVERYVELAYPKKQMNESTCLQRSILWPKIKVTQEEQAVVCKKFKLSKHSPLIGLCPGAEFGPAKRWPHYHYAQLAKKLDAQGYKIVLFGSKKDEEIAKNIYSTLGNTTIKNCYNLVGKTTLDQVVILLAACKGIVTNDTGLMHIAAALNIPLVALYGPTSPKFTPPLSNRVKIIRKISGYHKIRKSPVNQGYHQSLIDINPSTVMDKLVELL